MKVEASPRGEYHSFSSDASFNPDTDLLHAHIVGRHGSRQILQRFIVGQQALIIA